MWFLLSLIALIIITAAVAALTVLRSFRHGSRRYSDWR